MKNRSALDDIDPSIRVGKRNKNLLAIAGAVSALALAACTPTHAAHSPSKPSRTSVETPVKLPKSTTSTVSLEHRQEPLKDKIQKTAENFAERIIAEYRKGKSVHSFIYNPKDGTNVAVNVLYNTETLLKGAYGEYGLIASVHQDADGNLVSSSVDMIGIFENDNVAGKETATKPGDRLGLFSYFLFKDPYTGDWSVEFGEDTKTGKKIEVQYDTSEPTGLSNVYAPLDIETFETLTSRANTIFDWATQEAPVNYPPAIN